MGDWAPVCQQKVIYSLSGHHGWGHDCGRPVKSRRAAERKLGLPFLLCFTGKVWLRDKQTPAQEGSQPTVLWFPEYLTLYQL